MPFYGGSYLNKPKHLAVGFSVHTVVSGREVSGASFSSAMLKINPALGGKFEILLSLIHNHFPPLKYSFSRGFEVGLQNPGA